MNLQQAGEFGIIRRIQKRFPSVKNIPVGIGDDAAALPASPGKYTLLTTDTLIEGVHFDLAYSSFAQTGYKAVSVNLSDIAAMGGVPLYFVVSLGLSDRFQISDLDRLYRGISKASQEAGITLVGGNTCRSEKQIFIGITLTGEIAKTEMCLRSGSEEGDAIYVTGTLGDASAGIDLLRKGCNRRSYRNLTRRHQCPQARLTEGRLLAKERIPSAMIDISDGLLADLNHIMQQSRMGAEIVLDKIPVSPSLLRYAKGTQCDPMKHALSGGEDYELLFSVPEKKVKKLNGLIEINLISATRIGTIISRKKGLVLRKADGTLQKIRPLGYDHFKNGKKHPSS